MTRPNGARRWAPMVRWAVSALLIGSFAHAQSSPPSCSYADEMAIVRPADDGRWTVLDTARRLPSDFAPDDLVSLREAGFADDRLVRDVVVPDLRALREAAEEAGVPIEIQSAYRSYAYQERTFAYWVDRQGYDAALRTSARAGHSEHQLGTTVDLRARNGAAPWDLDDFAATPSGAWLAEHAPRFGFVMSYPPNATETSCYAYEPWHWRWIGRNRAEQLQQSGQVLRTFLWEAP